MMGFVYGIWMYGEKESINKNVFHHIKVAKHLLGPVQTSNLTCTEPRFGTC